MSNQAALQALGASLGLAACLVVLPAQTPAGKLLSFEVASIRENLSAGDNASVRVQPGGRLTVSNNSLRNIIRNAYNVQNFQIVGPDWINTTRWDNRAQSGSIHWQAGSRQDRAHGQLRHRPDMDAGAGSAWTRFACSIDCPG